LINEFLINFNPGDPFLSKRIKVSVFA